MARTYDERRSAVMQLDVMQKTANVDALKKAVAGTQWTVSETASYVGRARHQNRDLAIGLLKEKGNDSPTPRQVSSQMRAIQRWNNFEKGVTGKQAAKPSKENRSLLNRLGRNADLAKKGFSVKLKGEIAVNGYRRKRTAAVDLEGDRALSFLENPNYQDLGKAYLGNEDSLYGFDEDLQVDIIAE